MAAPHTDARAGLARSGDARSGYPIAVGRKALLYALSNVARSGATRSNYHDGRVYITIGGIEVGTGRPDLDARILVATAAIRDELHEAPTTATLTAVGFVPVAGDSVTVTLGSQHGAPEFVGTVLSTTHGAITSDPSVDQVTMACIDPTWGLDTRLVSEFLTGSATTIAQQLVSGYAPGYTTAIQPGLASLEGGVTFTNQELSDCLTHLCKRIGSTWRCDFQKVVHIPADWPEETPPTELNAVHPSLAHFTHDVDLSQQVTRVHVEGGGVTAAATLPPGETMIPLVGDPGWYDPAGGVVVSGPQRIRYTGVHPGGGGGLVGTGASPGGAPRLALVSGAGVPPGVHGYAFTFTTASGESLPGAVTSILTGTLPGPSTAPVAGAATAGTGPDPGTHDYAVTFVTATGETAPGPAVTAATAPTPSPTTALTVGAPQPGAGLEPGAHDYGVTFTTATGETALGPVSGGVVVYTIPPPASAMVASQNACRIPGQKDAVPWIPGDTVNYVLTFVAGSGETPMGPHVGIVGNYCPGNPGPVNAFPPYSPNVVLSQIPIGPPGTTGKRIYRQVTGSVSLLERIVTLAPHVTTFEDVGYVIGDPAVPGPPPTVNTAVAGVIPLSAIPLGASGTGITGRRIYRRSGGAGFRLLTTIANNTATTYTDSTPSSALASPPPAVGTAGSLRIPLSQLPLPDSPLVTARKLYGTAANTAGAAALRFVADLNLTVTTYTVTTPDAGLGAAPPATSTAVAGQVQVSGIALGSPSVTARKLYRTAAGSSALQLLATLANNTATTHLDAAPDTSLGAAPPTIDNSALQQPQGQVLPGETFLPVASLSAFPVGGGWAVIGNGTQVIKYAGVSGTGLTGVPAAGAGSITAAIAYNSTVTAAPALVGIPAALGLRRLVDREGRDIGTLLPAGPGLGDLEGRDLDTRATTPGPIRFIIRRGDDVNLWITETDAAAQAARAALLGGDGVQEDYHQDRRLSRGEARARALAILALKKDPRVTVRYTCRDANTRAGRTVVVNLGPPYAIYKVPLVIQSVSTSFVATRAGALATYAVEASSQRLTFEQLVAMIR